MDRRVKETRRRCKEMEEDLIRQNRGGKEKRNQERESRRGKGCTGNKERKWSKRRK